MAQRLHHDPQPLLPDAELISSEDVRQATERILNSKYFSQAPMKRKFVQLVSDYYVQNRATELSEYLIGREVYERNERYSPAEDPVVRVAAHDVRKRLEQYYQHEGKEDPVRLEIPLGSYEPVFKRAQHRGPETADKPAAAPTPHVNSNHLPLSHQIGKGRWMSNGRWMLGIGTILAVSALITITALSLFKVDLLSSSASQLTQKNLQTLVWEPFFTSDDPTILVLSNPPVYTLVNLADPEVVHKRAVELPPERAKELLNLIKEKGPNYNGPARVYLSPIAYTGIGEAIGVHRITDHLRIHGMGVTLKQSRNLSAEDLKDHNLVLLGGTLSNDWSGKLPVKEDFYFTPNVTLVNRHPQSGEQTEYRTLFDQKTGQILEDYALITVKPATQRKNTLMILGGLRDVGTGAAAEFVTGKTSLNELDRRLQQMKGKKGLPRYYQALLRVAVESNVPTTISLLALHEISVSEE